MKKAERILGIVSTSLFIFGVFFRIQHWPGGSVAITLAVLIFIFAYLPIQLILQRREAETGLQKFYTIFKFIAFFIILIAFVFKIQHWPGGGILLLMASVLLPAYIIVYFILRIKKQASLPFLLNDLLITLISYSIYLFLNIILISPDAIWGYIELEDRYEAMNSGLMSANEMIYESLDSIARDKDEDLLISIEQLRSLSNQLYHSSDSVKQGFYRAILGSKYSENADYQRLNQFEVANMGLGTDYFLNHENGKYLYELITNYLEEVKHISQIHNIQSGHIGMFMKMEVVFYKWREELTWESYMFGGNPVGSVIVNLSWIRQMVLLTETTVLNGLISQIDLSEEVKLLQELAARESDKAMMLKENEIVRVKQQQELQAVQLEQSQSEVRQNRMMAIFAFVGIALVLVLFSISTRAYFRKQRDNKKLTEQKDEISEKNEELNHQNEEIAAQRDEIEAQRDLVFRQKEQIEKTHEEISSSIDYATRLQASILPNTNLLKEKFQDHFVLFRPKSKVSGDFYWWTEVEKSVIIAVADCTGHGVPGAFMSMLGISLLREIVNKEFITQPGVILRRLRKEVIRSLDQKGEIGEQKDGMDLALVSIPFDTLKCEYAGANNPLYMLRDGQLTEYKADRMPISFYIRMDKFTTHEIQLQKGDQLYMFSDGYADQFGGENRKKFKYKAFQQHLIDHSTQSMEEQHNALMDTIVKWQGDYEQIDDIVIVGIKI
jgi:serine phosphatase RsbU (regulator of sigma subunit)